MGPKGNNIVLAGWVRVNPNPHPHRTTPPTKAKPRPPFFFFSSLQLTSPLLAINGGSSALPSPLLRSPPPLSPSSPPPSPFLPLRSLSLPFPHSPPLQISATTRSRPPQQHRSPPSSPIISTITPQRFGHLIAALPTADLHLRLRSLPPPADSFSGHPTPPPGTHR